MVFIIDVNPVISAIIKKGESRLLLIDSPFKFYAPDTLIDSIRKYESLIIEKSGLTKKEFEKLFFLIIENITITKRKHYEKYMEEANKLIGHIDIEDVPYIALALSVPNDGIWSNDWHFKKQDKIKVWETKDVLNLMKEIS